MNNREFFYSVIKTNIFLKMFGKFLIGIIVIGFLLIILFYQNILNTTSRKKVNENNYYPEDYANFAVNKAMELYDKNEYDFISRKEFGSLNQIDLEFTFLNNMSENEYKTKIKETVNKIYDEIKGKDIVKKYVGDSKDISIRFFFYVYDEKNISGKRNICGCSIHYMPVFDEEWPIIDDTYYLWSFE